jgi:SAM-dependent methyltransferase
MREDMGRFWDSRAAEDPFYFIDNRLQYRNPDLDRFWSEGERDLAQLLAAVGASIDAEDHVLEIGCGVGRLTRPLAGQARSVCALDVSERMLELARSHNAHLENVTWVHGDGRTLSGVGAETIDACVSHVVFQHIPDPQITLSYVREIGRVLRPGGWAAFQISNDARVHRGHSALRRAQRAVLVTAGRVPRGQDDPRWRGSMVSLDALRSAAADGSMQVDRVVGEGTQFCLVRTRRS